jgi:hypothetical protein
MKPRRILLPSLLAAAFVTSVVAGEESHEPAKPSATLWSLRKLEPPAVPSGATKSAAVDAFINARLKEQGLGMSPTADRPTLIRRLMFDLIGLPPSPQEIDQFVNDKSPRAYEDLVEQLLASPHYGERWARHWLDVARYTESQGFEYDRLRNNAWQYRDYVIKSFNDDKPYNRFMMEQIAGDVMEPVTTDGLVAVSLLVCGPWDQAGNSQANLTQKAITREEELEDLVGVVGQSFLGLTINCARCHAHKFDPIPHEEYYRVKAVFEGVRHGERTIATPAEVRAHDDKIAQLRKSIAAAQGEVLQFEIEARNRILTEDDVALRDAALARLKKLRETLDATKPLPVSYIGTRVQPEPTKRLKRGNVTTPQEIVAPGALSAVADLNADFGLNADAPESQRRLKFAEWVADPRNPLPARVMANRIWQYHFGRGLVATPSDFGANGARPTHPELLDWLACKFIESGWSLKALHRILVNSDAYKQQSRFNEKAAAVDADDQLLWRFPPQRLSAEQLRDAMLAVSGEINLKPGGPSFRPFKIASFNSDFYEPNDPIGAEFNRRTVYRMNVNSGKEPLLDAFDCPDPSVKTPRRGITTTPLQALALMNNSFVQRQATKFAERARTEANEDTPQAVRLAYRYALGRVPQAEELASAVVAARERGLFNVCWALLNSTEFLYVQ